MQAWRGHYKYNAWGWDRTTRKCCGAAQWATQRIAASYRTLADFYEQVAQQVGIGGTGALLRLLCVHDELPLGRHNPCLAAPVAATLALSCLPSAQLAEDLAAAEARRPPVIAVQPTLHLELPEALQQAPPRLDMCSECAKFVEQVGGAGAGVGGRGLSMSYGCHGMPEPGPSTSAEPEPPACCSRRWSWPRRAVGGLLTIGETLSGGGQQEQQR